MNRAGHRSWRALRSLFCLAGLRMILDAGGRTADCAPAIMQPGPAFFILAIFPVTLLKAHRATGEPVDFNRQVRPILSQNCFECHGPDVGARKANLRLDERESAVSSRDGVRAIDPERPEESALLARIYATDPEEVMPPRDSHKKLDETEKETLRRWIAQSAPYAKHWSLVSPERPSLPVVAHPRWSGHPIDRFIQAKLEAEGLEPSPLADREVWLRRITFDLTGLPPTPGETRAFVETEHPNAAERVADRLLASHRYGERMALAWMDAARYGDTSVMHADGNRDMWPWRDWLIAAYNGNKPFDEFTVEQLAGDLLPEATVEQKIGSGFNRNHATSDEGGAIDEELRVSYVVDRVMTTANVWLALTMECGQCHDHKYDPITQREYYQFYAYFNKTTDPGMQTRNGNQAPIVRIFSQEEQRRLKDIRDRLVVLEQRRRQERASPKEVESWAGQVRRGLRRAPPEFGKWHWLGSFAGKNAREAFEKDFGPEKERKFDGGKAYGAKKWVAVSSWADGRVHPLEIAPDHAGYLGRGLESERESKGTLWLGSNDGIKVWLDGKLIHENQVSRAAELDQDRVDLTLKPGRHWLLVKIVNDSETAGFAFRWESPAFPENIRKLADEEVERLTKDQWNELADFHAKEIWLEGRRLDQAIAKAKEEEKTMVKAAPTSMIMEDQGEKPRVTYILARGQYDQPLKDHPVEPGTPKALPPLPEEAPANRLGLARWLTQPDHPLTARVAVNRYWAMFLGQGIVRTVGDFGNQGEWPSHIELLDWLATDFVDSGWNTKRAVRQIVLSSTYGQSSRVDPQRSQRDPENRLLARGPRFRLPGEFIRDQALAVSGLLVERLGGPGVKPYQPPNIWNEVSLNGGLRYRRDDGEKLYRRSLYTFWKRSAPMPNMMIFDSPSREKCALERPRTNTPLQALVTLNDPQFVEAARVLAQRLLQMDGSTEDRIDFAYRLAAGRPASRSEIRILEKWLLEEGKPFSENEKETSELLQVGEYPLPADVPLGELAAWTLIAQMILNLDETLTRS